MSLAKSYQSRFRATDSLQHIRFVVDTDAVDVVVFDVAAATPFAVDVVDVFVVFSPAGVVVVVVVAAAAVAVLAATFLYLKKYFFLVRPQQPFLPAADTFGDLFFLASMYKKDT